MNRVLGSLTLDFYYFADGSHYFKEQSDTVQEKIRYILETCDLPQGFMCLGDIDNAFAGVFCGITQELYDEYPKLTNLSLGLSQSSTISAADKKVFFSIILESSPTIKFFFDVD